VLRPGITHLIRQAVDQWPVIRNDWDLGGARLSDESTWGQPLWFTEVAVNFRPVVLRLGTAPHAKITWAYAQKREEARYNAAQDASAKG
jgi:hypothetical protein